jgi:Glycosyltransferase family 87
MRRTIGIVLLLLGLGQLAIRAKGRIVNDVPAWDFASVYAAARTWMHGGNPYDLAAVVDTWHRAGAFGDRDVSYFATVYPPSSLVTVMPWAPLPAGPAMVLWMIFTVFLLAIQFKALAEMAGLPPGDSRRAILLGASLASAPLQFGILSGQLSLPAISLCIIAFWYAGKYRDTFAGVLLGLAGAIKPQIAGPFVLYYLLLRRVNIVAYAAMVGGVIWAIALAGMMASHVHWIDGWRQSIDATTVLGGVNDYGWTNRFRDEIVDLKMLIVGITRNPKALKAAIGLITALLLACYVSWFGRAQERTGRDQLLVLAALGAICLLPVYHRVYDVALLTMALAWGLGEIDGPRRMYATLLLVAMAAFLIPFDSVKSVGNRLHHLGSLAQNRVWQTLIIPHYAWALLATTIVLLLAMRKSKNVKA